MEENSGNTTQPTSANQTPQSVQAPPAPNVVPSPVQTVQPAFQQPVVNQQPEVTQPSGEDKPKSGMKFILIVAIVFLILALVAVGFYVMKKYPISVNQPVDNKQPLSNTTVVNQQQTSSDSVQSQAECDNFPSLLEACTAYTCQFTHPLTGEQLTKEIIGMIDGVCRYSEQMPNDGNMDCEYTEEMRKAIVKYYRDLENTEAFGFEISAEFGPEESDVKSTYSINGKDVENPLQEAIDVGQCEITGY